MITVNSYYTTLQYKRYLLRAQSKNMDEVMQSEALPRRDDGTLCNHEGHIPWCELAKPEKMLNTRRQIWKVILACIGSQWSW